MVSLSVPFRCRFLTGLFAITETYGLVAWRCLSAWWTTTLCDDSLHCIHYGTPYQCPCMCERSNLPYEEWSIYVCTQCTFLLPTGSGFDHYHHTRNGKFSRRWGRFRVHINWEVNKAPVTIRFSLRINNWARPVERNNHKGFGAKNDFLLKKWHGKIILGLTNIFIFWKTWSCVMLVFWVVMNSFG